MAIEVLTASGVLLGQAMDTMSAELSLRSNFAVIHLRAAVRDARNAHAVEQANLTADHAPWFDEMMLSVPVSIVMSGAALEASANETIQYILDGGTGLPVSNSRKLLLQDLKSDRAGTAIDRYRRLALLFDREPDTGTVAWDNAKLLVSFRNSFMHFKPAWDHEKDIHEGALVKRLKTKIPIYRAYASNFQFPYGFMTYGCAKWAVESVLALSAGFTALLGVKDRFIGTHLDYSLP